MKYKNPMIPGFHPDPSICRVGDDFYLVTSSFEYFPGVPIFHSQDLVNWRQIGHCLTRESQLNLNEARISGGIFAPTMRYHDRTFYMVTTNTSHGRHFFVTASDPAGEWSDPVWIADQNGIDPSLFWDTDGSCYFTSTYDNGTVVGILQRQIDLDTGQLLGEGKVIWCGTGGQFPEGPHMYQKDAWYYLLIAEGGTEYGHMVTLARSRSVWGPFEPCPHNPILTHRSLNNPIQATGHADLVEDALGHWWLVFLGIRPQGYPRHSQLGRETFLSPVEWPSDAWPVIGNQGTVALEMEGPLPPQKTMDAEPSRDDFEKQELYFCWNFLRNPLAENWSLAKKASHLSLRCSRVALGAIDALAFLGRRQEHFHCTVSASVDFDPVADQEEAGITVRMNDAFRYEVAIRKIAGQKRVFLRKTVGSIAVESTPIPIPGAAVTLSIKATPEAYFFSCDSEGDHHDLGWGEAHFLSPEVAGLFTGVYFGMYATASGEPSETFAHFDWFDYRVTE